MPKYKFTIFDADVGGNVHEDIFELHSDTLRMLKSVIDSYELESGFADFTEIDENRYWKPSSLYENIAALFKSPFFSGVSVWLPGHHRKITIAEIEENN